MSTDAPARERTLPNNLEAERTVLGAILVDNAAFNSAAEILNREDFYRDAHRRIYEAMAALAERSQPIDLVTLKDELTRRSALEAVGGAAFLAGLVDGVPRITNVEHWSRLIKEKAVLRNLIHAGNRIVQECYEGEDEPAELLDRAEKSIFDIAEQPHPRRASSTWGRSSRRASGRSISSPSRKDVVTGLATGFVDLDEMTERAPEGRPGHRRRPPGHGQDLVLPERRPARRPAGGGDRGALLPRDVPSPARPAAALRRRPDRRPPPAHRQAHREGLGTPGQVLRPTSPRRRSSSTTRRPSRRWRCAPSAVGSRRSTGSA